jgi:hypothetical protein
MSRSDVEDLGFGPMAPLGSGDLRPGKSLEFGPCAKNGFLVWASDHHPCCDS